jgi:hypothetical protein
MIAVLDAIVILDVIDYADCAPEQECDEDQVKPGRQSPDSERFISAWWAILPT